MSDTGPHNRSLLDTQARVPQHVVYRDFVHETVVLNLQTGTYHGLNPSAGVMLGAVDGAESLKEAAALLAAEHGWELATIENDLVGLCHSLLERGLLELTGGEST